jgi:hypothetical protein
MPPRFVVKMCGSINLPAIQIILVDDRFHPILVTGHNWRIRSDQG